MTENFELLDIAQIEIMHQQAHDRIEAGDNCDNVRLQHDSLAAELVKRGSVHDTEIICPESELGQVAPNYRRGFTDDICTQCAFGQLFPLCNLYKSDYTKGYTCDSFRHFEVLELPAPHGYLMLSEKQTAIVSDKKLDITTPKLIVSDGEAFGIAELLEPAQIKSKEFDSNEWKKLHRITPRERRQFWPNSDLFYVYRLDKWYSYEKSRIYETGKVKRWIKLSDEQKEQKLKAKELPSRIVLEENAVMIGSENKFILDPKVSYANELLDALKATYECDVAFATEDISGLPLYSLALIRNHKELPVIKKNQKQEEIDMPFEIVSRDNEFCVIKINEDGSAGDTMGCHTSRGDAESQLVALNINVTAEEERAIHDGKNPKKKPRKKKEFVEDDKQRSLDELPVMLRRQFENKFVLDGRDIEPLEVFSSDALPRVAGFVVAKKNGSLFRVEYVTNDLGTTFADETRWEEVTVSYLPKGYSRVARYAKEKDPEIKNKTKTGFMDKLRNIGKAISDFVAESESDGVETQDEDSKIFMTDAGVMQKEVNGELWHFTWSTNAFEDREGELFSTQALEKYVAENEARENKGYFNLWHINEEDGNFNTDFATKEWQGVIGRFLVESGPYLDNSKGYNAREFFKQYSSGHPEIAPEGWGCSPEFRYLPEERATGVYENIWITRTSTLPKMAAANIWTDAAQLARNKMALSESQMKAAIAAFGGEDEVKKLIDEGEKRTEDLEASGIAHKDVQEKPEIDIQVLAKEIGKQFKADISPLVESVSNTVSTVSDLVKRVEKLEGEQKLKDLTETQSFVWKLSATNNDETIVTEDDELKSKAPLETNRNQDKNNISPADFFATGN